MIKTNNTQTIAENVSIDIIAENAILLCWPETINTQQHQAIITCQHKIDIQLHDYVIETITSYNSLLIYYRIEKITLKNLQQSLYTIINDASKTDSASITDITNNDENNSSKIIEIPVYYGADAGWDLTSVAQQSGLSINQVIELHSQKKYRAYALGFTPGFCYLASLDSSLELPRKANPRKKVPKGAIAIAEQQTAVYPNESPGGWHIIGQTPTPMYSINNEEFTPHIHVGDTVIFMPIDKNKFIALGGTVHHE